MDSIDVYFTNFFEVTETALEEYGAFNISLLVDLPLFIDPFLLFNSKKPEYQAQHQKILDYLYYLRDHGGGASASTGLLRARYCFKEVKQNWFGFCAAGNSGHGLSLKFARTLHESLYALFPKEGPKLTRENHLEKLALIRSGVGKDCISDFTTNLIKEFLLEYTQTFALKHISPSKLKECAVERVSFDSTKGVWMPRKFRLPWANDDYVILTPKDILTQEDTWINKEEFQDRALDIPKAIGNEALRALVEEYFRSVLPQEPTRADEREAKFKVIQRFPELLDLFIKHKEDTGDQATSAAAQKVKASIQLYIEQFRPLIESLEENSDFYKTNPTTEKDTRCRINYLKDVVENKGGWRYFYVEGKALPREKDLHILFRMTWFGSPHDVTTEADDGRGPVDVKVSHGSEDKTLVEMKLARSSSLQRNLENQAEAYQKASDAKVAFKVIIFFDAVEEARARAAIKKAGLEEGKFVILIDARNDNKPSGSKAKGVDSAPA